MCVVGEDLHVSADRDVAERTGKRATTGTRIRPAGRKRVASPLARFDHVEIRNSI